MRRLLVAGVAMHGDGYPNAENTVALLKQDARWDVREVVYWLPRDMRLWHLVRGPVLQRMKLVLRLLVGGFVQAARLAVSARTGDVAYLPYPAPLTLWWLSLLPPRLRPRCIADAYISLWDSMFRDRGAGSEEGALSRIAHWFERRALHAASLVLVDTEANKAQVVADFSLAPEKVRSIPLAIDEQPFRTRAGTPRAGRKRKRVLFVGTLVPLHGIDVVLAAAARLAADLEVEFRVIGDGQQGDVIEGFMHEGAPENFMWVRKWQPLEAIAREIMEADVCLGVFGGAGKAARVLPFKLYYALAAGKAIVTQVDYSLPAGLPPLPAVLVGTEDEVGAAEQLAGAIKHLLARAEERAHMQSSAWEYFDQHLSGERVKKEWGSILRQF